MSANKTTFKTIGVDKNEAIQEMEEWLTENSNRRIMVSPDFGFCVAFDPLNEDMENPKMFRVAFSHCNTDEKKFRRNVGAWLAFYSLTNGEYTVMRGHVIREILDNNSCEDW